VPLTRSYSGISVIFFCPYAVIEAALKELFLAVAIRACILGAGKFKKKAMAAFDRRLSNGYRV
jgi:hypothetical protein